MSAIPITLIGTSTTDASGQTTFVGLAVTTGLGIGGGPMPGGPPLGIWGPTDPRPGNPISGIPGLPGGPGQQPGIWGPNDPRPSNPISGIPGLPGGPGQQPGGGGNGGGVGSWRWVYSPFYGWVLDPGAGGKPQPPGGGSGGQPYPDQSLPEPQPHPDQSLPEPQT